MTTEPSIGAQIVMAVFAFGGAMICLAGILNTFKMRRIMGFKSVRLRKGSYDDIRYPHVEEGDADAALKAHSSGNHGPITLHLRKGLVSVRVGDFTAIEIGT